MVAGFIRVRMGSLWREMVAWFIWVRLGARTGHRVHSDSRGFIQARVGIAKFNRVRVVKLGREYVFVMFIRVLVCSHASA